MAGQTIGTTGISSIAFLRRASLAVKRQLVAAATALHSNTLAFTALSRLATSGIASAQTSPGQHAEILLRHIQPATMLGRVVEIQGFGVRLASPSGKASYSSWIRVIWSRSPVSLW